MAGRTALRRGGRSRRTRSASRSTRWPTRCGRRRGWPCQSLSCRISRTTGRGPKRPCWPGGRASRCAGALARAAAAHAAPPAAVAGGRRGVHRGGGTGAGKRSACQTERGHPGRAAAAAASYVSWSRRPRTELAGHRVHGPFIVGFERRILAAPDRVHHRGDAVLARHPRVRPPLVLRLPPRADRDDGDLGQPPLDRRGGPQCRAECGQPPPRVRRGDERVERPGQAAVGGDGQVAPGIDDAVPQSLAFGSQIRAAHIGNPGHSRIIATTGLVRSGRQGPGTGDPRREPPRAARVG